MKIFSLIQTTALTLMVAFAIQACSARDQIDKFVPPTGNGQVAPVTSNPTQALLVSTLSSVDFGQVASGGSVSQSVTILSAGVKSAIIDGITVSLPSAFTVNSNTCSFTTLATSSSCTLNLSYSPTVTGLQAATFSLTYHDDGGSRSLIVPMSGSGGTNPALTFSESPYNYGSVATGNTVSHIFTVSNNTSVSANIGTASISGTSYSIAGQTCNSIILAPAASCTITVAFAPGSVASFPATITVPFTNSIGSPFSKVVTLGGTGVTPSTSFTFTGFTGTEASDTVAASKTSTGVTLKWTTQTLASYYKIRYTGGGSTIVSSSIFPTSVSTYPVSGLTPNTTYTFQINAYDTNNVSDGNSATVSIATPNIAGATFNGWSDAVATGSVFTDIGTVDTTFGNTGTNRMERNLSVIAGIDSSAINTGSNQITVNVDFPTGMPLTYRTDGTAASPLVNGTTYYAIRIDATTIRLATTYANAVSNTSLTLATSGSGNVTFMPQALAKIGWDAFTILPSGTATSYNIYRSTTSGSGFTQIGTSTSKSFIDYQVADEGIYYYKVHPVVSGSEVTAAAATDSEIRIYIPPKNMSLVHRWITNREACTNLLGFTWPAGVNRADNYSCAYTWGGGYAPNTTYSKSKWDIGYSFVIDRWQTGCKMGSIGTAAPTGGATNDVYLRKGSGTINGGPALCYIKDATLGWLAETSASVTSAQRVLMRTNYPGYTSTPIQQTQAYNSCQQRSATQLTDSNGNARMRLMRLHEATLARAAQGVNVNFRSPPDLVNIFNVSNLPANGSCNSNYNGTRLDGVTIPNPSTYSTSNYTLMNGSSLTRNCYSRYEISNLWDNAFEWTSSQYTYTSGNNGIFIASLLDAGDNLTENFAMNGVMGRNNTSNQGNGSFFAQYNNQPILPLFGIQAASTSADPSLGSMVIDYSKVDFGGQHGGGWVAYYGSYNGVLLGGMGSYYSSASRYQYSFGSRADGSSEYDAQSPVTYRCLGEVKPTP